MTTFHGKFTSPWQNSAHLPLGQGGQLQRFALPHISAAWSCLRHFAQNANSKITATFLYKQRSGVPTTLILRQIFVRHNKQYFAFLQIVAGLITTGYNAVPSHAWKVRAEPRFFAILCATRFRHLVIGYVASPSSTIFPALLSH